MTVHTGMALPFAIREAATDGWYSTVPQPGDWAERGACRHADPDLFFPNQGDRVSPALQVCARCPVRTACLEYALAAGPRLRGIWGGTTENERRRLQAEQHKDTAP
jgi:WhiB family redox-sensing transcriptional regulator